MRFDDGFLWVESGRNGRRTKSGQGRWVPMTPRLVAAMREHFARFRFASYNGKRTQWVFHHTRTRRHAKAGARIGSAGTAGTKGKAGRWVPMTPRLLAAMREHFARFRFATYDGTAPGYVFHHTRTRRHAKAGQRIRSLRRAFKGAAARAALPLDLQQHDLRHRRATTWLGEEGRNLVHVQEALGHADVRTTMGYTHLIREHLRVLVDPPPPEPARREA